MNIRFPKGKRVISLDKSDRALMVKVRKLCVELHAQMPEGGPSLAADTAGKCLLTLLAEFPEPAKKEAAAK